MLYYIVPTLVDILNEYMKITELSTITRQSSIYGYNFIDFSLMYIIGAYIRRFELAKYNLNYGKDNCLIE